MTQINDEDWEAAKAALRQTAALLADFNDAMTLACLPVEVKREMLLMIAKKMMGGIFL